MRFHRLTVATLLAFILGLAAAAFAQSDRGAIVGTVTDPSGAVVAGAKVTVTNLNTGDAHEAKTTGEGEFNVPELSATLVRAIALMAGGTTALPDAAP